MCIAMCYIDEMETSLSIALSELLRRTRGATQAKLGKYAGISQPYVSDLRNGNKVGGLALWEKIAEYFGMGYEEFYSFGKKIAMVNAVVMADEPQDITPAPTKPPQRRKTDLEIQADKTHEQLVGRFVDKETALKINQLLVRLEELENGDGLKAALEWAKYRVYEAEKKLGLDQRRTGTGGDHEGSV